jgi:hypothetical protein
MTDSLDITQLILEKHPNADKSILDRLRFLIEKHNLKWILFEEEVTFVMQHICEAKGVELNDFAKNYVIAREYYFHGKVTKLEGENLKIFKHSFNKKYGISFWKTKNLWVANYLVAYIYLDDCCLDNPKMYFVEVDIEREYKARFGGSRQQKLRKGRVDLVNGDEIIEFKKNIIDCNAVGQLLRYLKSCNKVKGKLVALQIHSDALGLIATLNNSGFDLSYEKVILYLDESN